MSGIREWLERQGLDEFADLLEAERVDLETLPELTDTDLKDLGLPLGPRKKLLKAIREAGSAPAVPAAGATSGSRPDAPAAAGGVAERRQLTVMFADLVGSTELSQRLDPEELREVNRAYQDAAKAAVERYGGYVARYMGDGVLAYFGYPQAHEDDAERAVRAGLALTDALPELATPIELTVRVGIATGPVVVGDLIGEGASQESAVVGETPNLAARLQGIAGTNRVVVADQTRRLTEGAFVYADLGEQALKGFQARVPAWEARGEALADSRFEARHRARLGAFVGREHDLGMLLERWERAEAGEGQAVLVSGEAGIGKSRVTEALRTALSGVRHVWLGHQCSPYHTNSALYPIVSQLERASGFEASDGDAIRLKKLEALLSRGRRSAAEDLPVLAALLSIATPTPLDLTPQERKARTFAALGEQLAGLADEAPVLWVFEDAHWADPTTRELLDHMIDRLQDRRALAVVTTRPDYEPAWARLGHASVLALTRLSKRQSAALVDSLTGGRPLPEVVLEQLVDRTDGVPLFVEELTKTVLESGLLVEHSDRFELDGALRPLSIPSTLQDSLTARLDRLADAKRVAQTGAAIGREFLRELLARVVPDDDASVARSLGQLVEAGLVFPRGVAPAERYVFKHALVQEAALDSMLRSTRQAVNRRIAEVLEAEFPAVGANEPEVLAHHYTEAGETERAIEYWERAGQRAAARSAALEAVSHLSKGLELLATLPESADRDEQELALQAALGPAQMAVRGFASDEVEQAYTRARVLCERTGRGGQLHQTLYGLFRLNLIRGRYGTSKALAGDLLAQAERQNDPVLRLTAHRAMGNSCVWLGEMEAALSHLERGTALYDRKAHRDLALVYGDDPGVDCLCYSALARWWLGYPDQAQALRDSSLTLARDLAHPFSLARALGLASIVDFCRRDLPAVAADAREMLELSAQRGFVIWSSLAKMMLGIAHVGEGDVETGSQLFRQGLSDYHATGGRLGSRVWPVYFADAHVRAGDVGASSEALAAAWASDDDTAFWNAELHRIEGDLGVRRGAPAATVEAAYGEALTVSRRQGARALELRAATSLARLWQEQGRRAEAAELLAPVYDWFTEGFGTPDLREAKALLDELA